MNVIDKFRGAAVDPQWAPESTKRDSTDLPPLALERLEVKLPELLALAEADSSGTVEHHEEHKARIGEIDAAIGAYRRDEDTGGPTDVTRAEIAKLERQKARERANHAKVLEANGRKIGLRSAFRAVLASCEKHAILSLGGTAAITPLVPEVTLEQGDRWSNKVSRLQSERKAKQAERFAVEGAPPPSESAVKTALSSFRRQAQGPMVALKTDGGGFSIEWPRQRVLAEPLTAGGIPSAHDALSLLAWAFPEKFEEEITRQVEAFYAGYDGPTFNPPEKRRALAKIDKELLRLEREEAEAIWQGLAVGEPLAFRPDTDPRAVLGLA